MGLRHELKLTLFESRRSINDIRPVGCDLRRHQATNTTNARRQTQNRTRFLARPEVPWAILITASVKSFDEAITGQR